MQGSDRAIGPVEATSTSSVLRVSTRPIADAGDLLRRIPRDSPVAWVRNGDGIVGWGVAARLEVRGRERFSRTQRWWNQLCASAVIDDTVSVPGTGAIAFGSFAFDPESDMSVVIVPKVVIGRRGGQSWITTIGLGTADPAELSPVNALPKAPTSVTWSRGSRERADWESSIADAITRINAGEIDKVVLARDIIADIEGDLDPRHLLVNLASAYPSTWTFSVDGLVGATPELLVRRTGDLVTSRVLAGTVSKLGDERRDASRANELLDSDKDLEEHEYAVNSVARALAAHCTDLEVPSTPHVLPLANVQHLATDVTGRLADGASVLALAASLHPTAAVCGTPTERAFDLIRDIEGMDRGRYAGPVGWFDSRGDGEFGIALRCAEIDLDNKRVRAFAGCGIVAGSNPAMEWAEADAKLIPIRSALSN